MLEVTVMVCDNNGRWLCVYGPPCRCGLSSSVCGGQQKSVDSRSGSEVGFCADQKQTERQTHRQTDNESSTFAEGVIYIRFAPVDQTSMILPNSQNLVDAQRWGFERILFAIRR